MSARYTPGPWHFVSKSSDDPTCPEFLVKQGTGYLATVDSSRAENAANARLIAAAPDLADTLRMIAAGHGCPSALAQDILERHSLAREQKA